jgi:hypothetical protein
MREKKSGFACMKETILNPCGVVGTHVLEWRNERKGACLRLILIKGRSCAPYHWNGLVKSIGKNES